MLDSVVIDKLSALPRHAQIEAQFRSLIQSGRLMPGTRIPAESEIAQTLGVSRMTVNKAILTLTREGFFQRERGLGTFVRPQPDDSGRHLTIMVPFGHSSDAAGQDYYFAPLSRAMQAEAESRHHRVSLAYLPEGRYLDYQQRRPADGFLLISPNERRLSDVRALHRAGVPVVVVGARWAEIPEVPMVDSDNVAGGAAAVRYLNSLGHERIALLYAGPESSNTQDRRTGYRQALRELGSMPRHDWEIQADSAERIGSASARLKSLLSRPVMERPTAIFAAGYYLALEVLSLAHHMRLAVPEALSVVGYDDPFAAQLTYPPLTTLRQPLAEMGQSAAALLDAQLHGEAIRNLRPLYLPELQVRGSASSPSSLIGLKVSR